MFYKRRRTREEKEFSPFGPPALKIFLLTRSRSFASPARTNETKRFPVKGGRPGPTHSPLPPILEFRARFARAQFSCLDFKGWHPAGGRVTCTPDPGPGYSFIYILEFRARFARALSGTPSSFPVMHLPKGVPVARNRVNTSLNVQTPGLPRPFKHKLP